MKRILTSIWFLALILTIPLIVLLPPVFTKYKIEVDTIEKRAGINGQVYFEDLNKNGRVERIESFEAEHNMLSFHVFNAKNQLYDQFNFPYSFNKRLSRLFFFDCDKDGFKEVCGFTMNEDSVFLSFTEPFDSRSSFHTFFITTIDTRRRTEMDISVNEIKLFDFDGDGNDELVFSPSIGYNWFPRKLFMVHPDTEEVESSEEFGVHFSALTPVDIDADGKEELLCVGSSAENIPVEVDVKYHDNRPRLFIMNAELGPQFQPIEFPKGIGSRINYYVLDEKQGHLMVLYFNYSTENPLTFACQLSADGREPPKDTFFFEDSNWKYASFYRENDNRFMVFTDRGRIFWIDSTLQLIDKKDLQFKLQHIFKEPFDILDGHHVDYYTLDAENKIHLFLNDFEDEIVLEPEIELDKTAGLVDSPGKNKFVLVSKELMQFTSIYQNPLYYLKYPGYLLIYFLMLLLIWFWQKARMRLVNEKYELRNQVRELRLKTFRNQLNPHFIFNTFNGVASVIKKGNTQQAYEVFMRFSRMTRSLLDNFEESIVPLRNELDLVRNYIELQKFRFKDLFDYEIQVEDKSIYNIPLPRMIIQIHVENAIQHGLIPKAGKGFLKLEMKMRGDTLNITIEDNGIGREKSKATQTEHNGLGLKTIKSVIDEVNHGKRNKIRQEIIDLKTDHGEPCGTRIELYIPKKITK